MPSSSLLHLHAFPTRRCSDLDASVSVGDCRFSGCEVGVGARSGSAKIERCEFRACEGAVQARNSQRSILADPDRRSEEHTSELQSLRHLVCRLLLEKKKKKN